MFNEEAKKVAKDFKSGTVDQKKELALRSTKKKGKSLHKKTNMSDYNI